MATRRHQKVPDGLPVRTTCAYCGVGCGVIAVPDGRGGAAIAGDPEHPANYGRLCSKGSALGETLGLETRLLYPEIGGIRASWDAALDRVATGLARVRDTHGPGAIAFYLSGQLLTEDYYAANKLAKGFLGTPHVDTNSRLCMASTVAGHRRAFGADVVPQCYDDLELADLVVLSGSNAAWCHPILYQRIQVARGERGMRVVNIDPRRTATSEGADLQLSLAPGSDVALWNGLLVWLVEHQAIDATFIRTHTEGFTQALSAARAEAGSVTSVSAATGLSPTDIETFYGWWAGTPRVVSCTSQGVNQSVQGTDKVNAILNCHLATGRIGKPGSGPLSFTGQPNAMGGREVGGLANMLAAHMGFSEIERDRVQRFWKAPNLVEGEGKKAVAMFDAIADGSIKALWVMGTNPAVSLPGADRVRADLAGLELLIVSDNVRASDTVDAAGHGPHVRLPAAAWGEKDGTVTNSERRISRQRSFLPVAGEARPDWWILSQVARRLGWGEAFAWTGPDQIFTEHARLSGFENTGERAFDISGLERLSKLQYDTLSPIQWPVLQRNVGTDRMFEDGGFLAPGARARLIPVRTVGVAPRGRDTPTFVLNTGRVRDQWHTMTRTGLSARLSGHIAEPFVEVHPDDASTLGLEQGTIARVETETGAAELRVLVNKGQKRGSLFVPIHWSGQNSSSARIGALIGPAVDPFSGQPDSKAMPTSLAAVALPHFGFMLARRSDAPAGARYWARARTAHGYLTNFAMVRPAEGWQQWARRILPDGERLSVEDDGIGVFRAAVFDGGRLDAVLFVADGPKLPAADWLAAQMARTDIEPSERRALLAGRPIDGAADDGALVCVCFQIGAKRLCREIANGAATTQAIGAALGAGTNCGSCLPEIKRLIATESKAAAASTAASRSTVQAAQ